MHTYVAFLRGINVGGRVVRMVELKACFEKLGYADVVTLLQSGNVRFEAADTDSTKLKQEIEASLTKTFHYPARVQVLPLEKLHAVVAAYPFGTASDSQHDYVIFLENGLEGSLVGEAYAMAPGEQLKVGDGVVYWRVDKGSTLQSAFAKLLTKAKYKEFNTNRNLRTVRKLLDS